MTKANMIESLFKIYKNLFSGALRVLFGGGCRYQPTCSSYAKEAIARFGVVEGTALSLKRLLRCHPLAGFGFDPVPEER